MATDRAYVEYVVEQAGLGSRLSFRKMFGEYALYLDGKVVALACDNSLFVKPTAPASALAPQLPRRPPYPGARDHALADALLDDPDALRRLLTDTGALLPAPKPRRRRAAGPAG